MTTTPAATTHGVRHVRYLALARIGRVLAVLALLAVTVLGAAHPALTTGRHSAVSPAGRPVPGGPGSVSWFVLAAGGLCVVLAGLVLLPVIWWERVVGLLIVLVVVVLVAVTAWWAIHLATSSPAGSGTGQAATSTGSPPASGPAALGGSGVSGAVLLMAGGAALAVFVIILLAWWRQRQRRLARPSGSRVVSAGLADAVTAARSALSQTARSGGDRAAILACYAALEQALVEHGVTRRGADTPSEHLRRAAQAGVLPANAAHVLLGLFHRARFSDHPVGPADRARAERALEEAAACLREASG